MDHLRKAGGEDVDFVLDGAGKLTPGDAGSVAASLERFHLLWFDEPCSLSNLQTIRKISDESVTPLGFGRGVQDASAFQDLLRQASVDILRPDLNQYGISRIRQVATLAETYYVAVAPNHEGWSDCHRGRVASSGQSAELLHPARSARLLRNRIGACVRNWCCSHWRS